MTTWRHLNADCLPQWHALTNVLAEADRTEEYYALEDLAEELVAHGFEPARDSWAIWDGEDLVGYGQLLTRLDNDDHALAYLGGGIRPDHRGRGLGRQLMDRMEGRAVEAADERYPGAPQLWRASGLLEGASVRPLLEHRGYSLVRYFNEMRLELPAELSEAPNVDAVLVSPRPEHAEAVRVAHNLAFRDHWGSAQATPENWADSWTARANRMDLSSLALASDGAVLAYVLVEEWVPGEAYISRVGTVPSARGRGLAQACLVRTAGLAGRMERLALDVDSASLTGATRLYERVGFHLHKVTASYQRLAERP